MSRATEVLKIHLVQEIKVTRVRFLNRRQPTYTPPAETVNCGVPVAAVHADPVTCIHTRIDLRRITHARPSSGVPALTTSENVITSITFASVRRQYQ